MVLVVLARQHRSERLAVAAQRDVGDEAQPPLVDADQRNAEARQLSRDAEHGAVAADDDRDVALLAELGRAQRAVVGQAGVERRFAFQRDLQPLADQEVRDLVQHIENALRVVLAHECSVTKASTHARDYTTAIRSQRRPK